jgi:antitoxin HicB
LFTLEAIKSCEFKRWLSKQGATFPTSKGSHLQVTLNGKTSVFPMHGKDLKTGTAEAIKKHFRAEMKERRMLAYPVTLTPENNDGGFVVTFRDIPEAITPGETVEESLAMAAEALELAMDFYFEVSVPCPCLPLRSGASMLSSLRSACPKVLLLNEMIGKGVRPAELARRLKTTRQEVNRLTDLHHTTKTNGMAGAMKVLGKTLEICVV